MVLLATSTIIGIIVAVALVATTVAVCLYLYSQKSRDDEIAPDETKGEEQ